MKRWKKALSGLLMVALMATGISFPENVFAASEGMDGLPSVVNSGIGKMVDKSSTIDGTYNFTPVIGANTKIRFGCSDGSGSWDNKFCLNAEQYAHACSQWWPLSNINDGGNTRSFIPYEKLKGKMYAEYTNVGNANGLPVTMRIWFEDWQNTNISGYLGYEDVDNVIVSVDSTKGGVTPVIDIKIIASNVLLLLPIISLFLLLSLLFLGVKAERQSASSAYDGACYLAAKYESGGNPDQVGGDGGNACGEFQFDNRYELGPFVRWCYEKDPTTYGPFEPYLGMTTELKNNAGFYGAWHSICIEHKIAFEAAQCEYVYTQTLQPLLTSLTEYYGFDFTNASDALKGCVLSFGNRDGKYVVSLKRYFDGTTSASTDREIIERAYDAMIARRPNVSRWSYEKADCLAQLDGTLDIYAPSENGAGGIDWSWKKSIGAGESGNAAVQAALNAVGSGYSQSRRDDPGWYDCSSLVYRSYAAAGITYLNGMDAASEAECLVNKGMTVSYSELQPGDLIFYSYSANGKYRNISHVAIYLGNGEMVHAADESRGVCKQAMSQSNLSPQLYCRPQ